MDKKTENKKIGIKEIAKMANVSIATVDRVLNNRKDVSDKTRAKVQAIIKEHNYQPNLYARALSVKNNLSFAVLIPKTSSQTGYWDLCLKGIKQGIEEFSTFGISIDIFLYDQEDVRTFIKTSENVLSRNFNAVVIAPIFISETTSFVEECKKRKIETIFVNSDIKGCSSLGYIGPDLNSTGRLAANLTSYLVPAKSKLLILNIARGLQNYAYLNTKIDGYTNYLDKLNREFEIVNIDIPSNNYDEIAIDLLRHVGEFDPDLIFVTNSRVSVVGRFFNEFKHIKKPHIIGFDFLTENVEFLANGMVDFLICQRPDKQGYLALNYLYRHFLLKEEKGDFKPMPIDILTIENYLFYEN
ncbi:substrate-binding domain-containing protein [Sphingobacterium paucimobilis]|uniref:HTH lacI-type domain-containing protein n=1 Tax=Sphingobacterium paucimobilis HER1398 TaxID=1346330 RepID=U2H8H7_9SPHI|nr:LacI family DNA-binding transcriptional regulator [Sphingobacterium paucimobilis]ERJ58016.1 hypothetical protein M472_04490 [Sphingobacterium paucimobilis HER1398]